MPEHRIKNEVIYCEATGILKTIRATLLVNFGPDSKHIDNISVLDNTNIFNMVFDVLDQYHRIVESLNK